MISLNEKFLTIQGEGEHIGETCVFIRLNHCFMRCPFCDSKYAVYEEQYNNDPNYEEYKNEELPLLIDYIKNNCNTDKVVITGGEPLNDKQIDGLVHFIDLCKKSKIKVTFETTLLTETSDLINSHVLDNLSWLYHKFGLEEYDKNGKLVTFSCSPKIDTKCYDKQYNVKLDQIIDFYSLRNCETPVRKYNFYYKFVYYKSVHEQLLNFCLNHIPDTFKDRVLMMPLTPLKWDQKKYNNQCIETVEFCKKYGFRFSPRIHIDLYGLKRGV